MEDKRIIDETLLREVLLVKQVSCNAILKQVPGNAIECNLMQFTFSLVVLLCAEPAVQCNVVEFPINRKIRNWN